MAAAWGMPTTGAWAQQVEEEEQDRGGELDAPSTRPVATFSQNAAFPSLGEAVKKKESKKEKKAKPTKMNLADFQTSYKPPSASRRPTVNDDQILSSLPTAPRTRGDDDAPSAGLGGAFKDYGGRDRGDDRSRDRDRGGFFGRRDGSQDGSQDGQDDGPSRADEADDWGASRKFVPSDKTSSFGGGGGFRDRRDEGREGAEGEDAGPSRADTTDDWGASRKFAPSSARTSGTGGFEDRPRGGGFSERRRDEFEDAGPSRADTESRWGNRFVASSGGGGGSGFEDRDRERGSSFGGGSSRGEGGDSWGRRPSEGDLPSAASGGAGRPRLKLAPRTKPLPVLEVAPDPKAPEKAPEPEPAPLPSGPPKPRANPFGAARPREEVLKEKGVGSVTADKEPERQAPDDSWSRKKAEIQEGMKKLPAEVAQGSAAEMPEEATPSDDEDTAAAAAAISAHSAAGEKHTVAIEAQDATETKPLLVSEQDPAPPVQDAEAQPATV